MDVSNYCREVETYLCKKNEGHLIRLVGPAFNMVQGWADAGIPLKVVCRGIDERISRVSSIGRRRPLRIEFCEPDVLAQFDDWRRAVGAQGENIQSTSRSKKPPSLSRHLDRLMTRLTAILVEPEPWLGVHAVLNQTLQQLDDLRTEAKGARGVKRARLKEQLALVDEAMLVGIQQHVDSDLRKALQRQALQDLEPFRDRMSFDVFQEAATRSADRLIREKLGLPHFVID